MSPRQERSQALVFDFNGDISVPDLMRSTA